MARSKNTIDLSFCTTAQTKDSYEYVKFYFDKPVQAERITVIVQSRGQRIDDPFFHIRSVVKAYPTTLEESTSRTGLVSDIIFEIKYGSNMHRMNCTCYAEEWSR